MNRLIAFEGGDGVGKATQSKALVEALELAGHKAFLYSFPRYDTMVGAAIRRHLVGETTLCGREFVPQGALADVAFVSPHVDDPLMFQCMMLADKYDAEPAIERHLREGAFVVCDRWMASSFAYGASDGLPAEWLERVHGRLTSPSLTFFLTVPEAVALARRPGLRDRYEKDRGKQVDVADRYMRLAMDPRWVTVDGSGTKEDVAELIWSIVSRKFFK